MKKSVVLAFSGGLDTSYCAIYLSKNLNLTVHAVIVNTGGFSVSEIKLIERKALLLGVETFVCLNETENFYNSVVKYLVYGNVLKNNTYPLSVSAERISQATAIANYAKKINANYVAHGSTGAGNDQVRFDAVFNILIPNIEIITPIRDNKLSREEEIAYLKENDIVINAEKAKYSINKGIWGTSVGGMVLPLDHYLKTGNFDLSDSQRMLVLAGIAFTLFFETKRPLVKLLKLIKDEGLTDVYESGVSKGKQLKESFLNFMTGAWVSLCTSSSTAIKPSKFIFGSSSF